MTSSKRFALVALEDEDVDADEAAELKEEAEDDLAFAYKLSRASQVAANLGVTTAKLNAEFRDARRAILLVRIAAAEEDGDIDAEEAAELREELEEARLPGYKAARGSGLGAFGAGGCRGRGR